MDSSRIFKFASVRNAVDAPQIGPETSVLLDSELVSALVAINGSTATKPVKLQQFNAALQSFVDGVNFIKTKAQFQAGLAQSGTPAYMELLYDNIVARVLSRSNTSPIYKLLVDQLKTEHFLEYVGENPELRIKDIKILLPDGLIYSFIDHAPSTVGDPVVADQSAALGAEYKKFTEMQQLIEDAKRQQVKKFLADGKVLVAMTTYLVVNEALKVDSISVPDAEVRVTENIRLLEKQDAKQDAVRFEMRQMQELQRILDRAKDEGVTELVTEKIIFEPKYESIAKTFNLREMTIEEAERQTSAQMLRLSADLFGLVPADTYALVGDQWVRGGGDPVLTTQDSVIEDDGILVFSDGCWLKFPFQIADLRVVEQQTVGYLPGEIAHINNTQPGELNTRVTRRLKRTETEESLLTEEEIMRETDTQSTEKFGFEKTASQVQQEESSWNVNASVSGSYGPISASLDAGYENSTSSTSSNSFAQNYAKEVVQKVVDRITSKVKQERSVKTIEEFEETVTHVIDNTTGTGPKSYVYRWLNKLTRATLKNYGKRLIFQLDIAHPSHYHLSRIFKEDTTITLPQDPRKLEIGGVTIDHPTKITRDNYLAIADMYRTKVDAPPVERVVVSKGFAKKGGDRLTQTITIPKGYGAGMAKMYAYSWNQNFIVTVAASGWAYEWWSGPESLDLWGGPRTIYFNTYNGTRITDNVDVTIWNEVDYMLNFEVECLLAPETFQAWQVKTFNAIVEAYEQLKQEAEAKMGEFNPNNPGLNPQEKLNLIRMELRKEAIRKMMRCNPLGIKDKYEVGKEYQSECCVDNANAEKVRFLETVFDWRNMTYEFFPYFYGSRDVLWQNYKVKDNWDEIQKFKDSDPHFEAFLQASYASIRIPVHRDQTKEIAAINFIFNNSIANYEVAPESAQSLLDELQLEPVTLFTYDLDGNELPLPKESVDLGIFNLPTDLVILECGTQDGVKPIGFPQDPTPPTSDVIIPKQYSPAIIADTCNTNSLPSEL
jgi:hypothetical protein